jgi:hypothetical protein
VYYGFVIPKNKCVEKKCLCLTNVTLINRTLNPTVESLIHQTLHEFMARCFVEELVMMVREGDVSGISVADVDLDAVKARALQCTNFLLEIGFDVFDAIDR